jgi:hypothetical protein
MEPFRNFLDDHRGVALGAVVGDEIDLDLVLYGFAHDFDGKAFWQVSRGSSAGSNDCGRCLRTPISLKNELFWIIALVPYSF